MSPVPSAAMYSEGVFILGEIMKPLYYKLVGTKVVPCTVEEWAKEPHPIHIAKTDIEVSKGEEKKVVFVSTVFLGVDYSPWEDDAPAIFETMAFYKRDNMLGDVIEDTERRYRTYDEAEEGHKEVCNYVRKTCAA